MQFASSILSKGLPSDRC